MMRKSRRFVAAAAGAMITAAIGNAYPKAGQQDIIAKTVQETMAYAGNEDKTKPMEREAIEETKRGEYKAASETLLHAAKTAEREKSITEAEKALLAAAFLKEEAEISKEHIDSRIIQKDPHMIQKAETDFAKAYRPYAEVLRNADTAKNSPAKTVFADNSSYYKGPDASYNGLYGWLSFIEIIGILSVPGTALAIMGSALDRLTGNTSPDVPIRHKNREWEN